MCPEYFSYSVNQTGTFTICCSFLPLFPSLRSLEPGGGTDTVSPFAPLHQYLHSRETTSFSFFFPKHYKIDAQRMHNKNRNPLTIWIQSVQFMESLHRKVTFKLRSERQEGVNHVIECLGMGCLECEKYRAEQADM